jgi:hypothetical protein
VVEGRLVNSKSVEGKLVILAKMGGGLVNCCIYINGKLLDYHQKLSKLPNYHQ